MKLTGIYVSGLDLSKCSRFAIAHFKFMVWKHLGRPLGTWKPPRKYAQLKHSKADGGASDRRPVQRTAIPLVATLSNSGQLDQDHSMQLELHCVERGELFSVPTQSARIKHAASDQHRGSKR